ncbi:nuclear pore complex protein Nup214 isoform X1, partial [Tachysurus ichikawai]
MHRGQINVINAYCVAVANLTEVTLKNVPQVVNVQELKDNGAPVPVSTDTSSSMASSADQTFQQVLATVEAKK